MHLSTSFKCFRQLAWLKQVVCKFLKESNDVIQWAMKEVIKRNITGANAWLKQITETVSESRRGPRMATNMNAKEELFHRRLSLFLRTLSKQSDQMPGILRCQGLFQTGRNPLRARGSISSDLRNSEFGREMGVCRHLARQIGQLG